MVVVRSCTIFYSENVTRSNQENSRSSSPCFINWDERAAVGVCGGGRVATARVCVYIAGAV